ncbi:MAG: hypothetical protein ABI354_01145 [Candidatus Saccharimonadales bacterium]
MFNKILSGLISKKSEQHQIDLYRNLVRHEAKLGGTVFGPIPKGHRREFFCLDSRTWVWHEEWKDEQGVKRIRTTRYDIRPDGILKSQHGQYQRVKIAEARRLYSATKKYMQIVNQQIYAGVR